MSLSITDTKTIGTTEKVLINRYNDGTLEYQRLLGTTGTTVSGSPTISAVVSTNGIFIGAPISGAGIPAGATVAGFVANTSITLSANATASASGVALTINKTVAGSAPSRLHAGTTRECTIPSFLEDLVKELVATA
jgi:hypothetical protein